MAAVLQPSRVAQSDLPQLGPHNLTVTASGSDLTSEDLPVIFCIPTQPHSKYTVLARKFAYICLSYALSITINLFNTYLFSQSRQNLGFPVFAASLYDVVQYGLAVLAIFIIDGFSFRSVFEAYRRISVQSFCCLVLPCAGAAALDIALSNTSLRYIDLSLFTMIKSCSPVFVMIFAILLGLEKPSISLLAIMTIIGAGVALTVWDSVSFNWLGFILVATATVMAGARWALTQLIMDHQIKFNQSHQTNALLTKSDPLHTILYLAPVVSLALVTLSILFEGPIALWNSEFFGARDVSMRAFGSCAIGGALTFLMVLAQYKVVEETSVLTLSLLGIVKELLLIESSVLLFGDVLKPMNLVGAGVSILGILLYQIHRWRLRRDDLKFALSVIGSPQSSQRSLIRKRKASTVLYVPTSATISMLIDGFESDEDHGVEEMRLLKSTHNTKGFDFELSNTVDTFSDNCD